MDCSGMYYLFLKHESMNLIVLIPKSFFCEFFYNKSMKWVVLIPKTRLWNGLY